MRTLGLFLAAVLIVCNLAATARGVSYSIIDVGTLGGDASGAYCINNSGDVVGWAYTSDNHPHAFLYSGGTMHDLGTLGGSESCAYGINSSGQVVGYVRTIGGDHAFLYSGGTMHDLGIGGTRSIAFAINDTGQVVGRLDSGAEPQVFLYTNGAIQVLGLGVGLGINDYGQIAIWATPAGQNRPTLYSAGIMHDLGTLGGDVGGAYSVNDSGQVVGWASTSDNHPHAFLYSGGTMHDLGTLGGTYSHAYGINDTGQVVGYSFTTGDAGGHGFLWQSGSGLQDLNNLIVPSSGWTVGDATAINDNGLIVGSGTNPSGQLHAFVLTPTPEPSTLALLGAGSIILLVYAWRRRKPSAR